MCLQLTLVLLGFSLQGKKAFQHFSLQNLPENVRKDLGAAPFAGSAALQAVNLLALPSLGDLQSHF